MLRWLFTRREPKKEPKALDPTLIVSVNSDGNVQMDLALPSPLSQAEFDDVAQRVSGMLMYLNGGRMYHLMQQAVGAAALRAGSETLGQHILRRMDHAQMSEQERKVRSETEPCVKASKVFSPPEGVGYHDD